MKNIVRTALRGRGKSRNTAFVNIFGLALGLACCILILMWIRDERSFDRFNEHFDTTYRIVADWPKNGWNGVEATPQPLGPLVREQLPEVLDMVRFAPHSRMVFRYKDKSFYENRGLIADPSLFRIFSFRFLKGSAETAFSSPFDMVVSESLARKYFGDEDPIGKIVEVEGQPAVVTGVFADIPRNSTLQFDFMSSFEFIKDLSGYGLHWGALNFNTFLLLRPDAPTQDVGGKITALALENECPQVKDGAGFRLQPLSAVHLDARPYQSPLLSLGDSRTLLLFSVIAAYACKYVGKQISTTSTCAPSIRSMPSPYRATCEKSKVPSPSAILISTAFLASKRSGMISAIAAILTLGSCV